MRAEKTSKPPSCCFVMTGTEVVHLGVFNDKQINEGWHRQQNNEQGNSDIKDNFFGQCPKGLGSCRMTDEDLPLETHAQNRCLNLLATDTAIFGMCCR